MEYHLPLLCHMSGDSPLERLPFTGRDAKAADDSFQINQCN
jgi:hypothetical protein